MMELKSNFGGGKGTLDSEGSSVERVGAEFKNIFFRVIQSMLKDEEQSILINSVMILIQLVQLIYIPFNYRIYEVWQNNIISSKINIFTGYFLFSTYLTASFDQCVLVLYVCLGLIFACLMLFFMISYSFSQKNSFTWPVYFQRILVSSFVSVLYMPIMDLFFSIITCQESADGTTTVLINYPTVVCWSNTHIFHGTMAIIGIVLFYFLTMGISLTYFECRYLINDANARISGRPIAMFLTYELIMVICYSFFDSQMYDYLQIAIMLGGSYTIFWKIYLENPFYNKVIAKLWSILVAINLWTILLLTFSKFLEGVLFFGTVYAWLVGLVLLTIVVIRSQKYHFHLLLLNVNKVQESELILKQCQHVIDLYHNSSANPNCNLMLDGFLEIHRAICNREDCYLKQKKTANQRMKPIFKEGSMSERDIDLIMVISQTYFNSIKKFPNDISLRIRYAFFLLDHMKQKQLALNELQLAESLSPSLDNEFIIYRYKRIIEDEMNTQQTESLGSQDFVSEVSFQANMRSFQNKIERATLMHMDFWSQLQEDSPDLGKLNDIGAKINLCIQSVEDQWTKLQKNISNLPKAMRLYGKFIIEVLQDKDSGEDLLEKSRRLQIQNNKMKNKMTIGLVSGEDIGTEPLPTLIISTAQDKFAQITNLNFACCNLFGYNKSELQNRKINLLMPNIYSKYHDQYIEHFLNGNESKYVNRERMIFIKLKSNYVMPCFINLKVLQSMDQNVQVVAQFRLQKLFKPQAYFILDKDSIIDSISPGCIALMNLDSKQIFHKKTGITELFPTFDQNRDQYISKTGAPITYIKTALTAEGLTQGLSNVVYDDKQDILEQTYQCQLTEIYLEFHDHNLGYIMKLENVLNDHSRSDILAPVLPTMSKPCSFQLKMNPLKLFFMGEYIQGGNSFRVDQSIIWEGDQSMVSYLPSAAGPNAIIMQNEDSKGYKKTDNNNSQGDELKINYAEGIKTVRLFEDRVQDIDDAKEEMDDDEEQQLQEQRSLERNNEQGGEDQEFSLNDFNNIFRSRKNLQNVVNAYQTPRAITNLKIVANLLMLILVLISFIDYFLTMQKLQQIRDNVDLINNSNTRISQLHSVITAVQNLKMYNQGVLYINPNSSAAWVQSQRDLIGNKTATVSLVHKQILLSSVSISADPVTLQTQTSIRMFFSYGKFVYFDLNQGTQQIIAKALNIQNALLTNITMDNPDVFFVEYNLFNDYYLALRNSTDIYVSSLQQKCTDQLNLFLIILMVSAASLFLALLILIPTMLKVDYTQEQILSLFLDIPEKTVKYLYNKSENFISNLQVGEEEEILSEMDELDKEELAELNRTLRSKRKKKKFKNTNNNQRNYIFSFIIVLLIFQAYYVFNYYQSESLIQNMQQFIPELNVTSYAKSFYRYVENAERELYLNSSFLIENMDPYALCQLNINRLYAVDSSMHQEHSINVQITNSLYNDAFNQVIMLNPCPIFTNVMNVVSYNSCSLFADGSIYQGMAVGLTRYFENIRYMLTVYEIFSLDPNASFVANAKGYGLYTNITTNSNQTNNILSLENFNQSKESRIIQQVYIKATFDYLMSQFIASLQSSQDSFKTQRLALFIVFIIVLFVVYFVFWLPLIIKMTRDIWRTRQMIIMIPLKVIQRIKSIKLYIKEFIHAKEYQG